MSDIPPYPLLWPNEIPRTPPNRRKGSPFKASLHKAIENVRGSLRRFGTDSGLPVFDVVATTNIGGISLAESNKTDPGVAVWFKWEGAQRCIAVDRYPKPEDNLQAIHYVIEARRTEARHGGLMIARTAFKGFMALPNPDEKHWTITLGLAHEASLSDVKTAYRELSRKAHPDASGGSSQQMARLNRARDAAIAEINQ